MNEEEKQFRKEQIDLLNAIVAKLVLIESGQEALEKSIYCGVTRSTNKMLQKMRSEVIKEIRLTNKVKRTIWERIKHKYFHYRNRVVKMFLHRQRWQK